MGLRLVRENGCWHVTGRLNGVRVRRSTRLPDTAAYKAMAEKERLAIERGIFEKGAGKSYVPVETFKDAAKGYESWRKMEGRLTYETERVVERLVNGWGEVKLIDITRGAIETYAMREWAGLKPGSVRRYLNVMRAILRHAQKNVSGFDGVEVPIPRVNDARDTHFDEVQANAFLEWAKRERAELYPHFVTLIDTGVRLNEMMALRITSFGAGVVKVRRSLKTGKTITRDIPLSEEMVRLVEGWKGRRPGSKLYVVGKGVAKWDVTRTGIALNKALREGCKAIGLDHLAEGETSMRVHDLRHTFAYLTAKAGADVGDLQYLMGHEDVSMTMRYRGFIQSRARTYVGLARRVAAEG
jgi:integrase